MVAHAMSLTYTVAFVSPIGNSYHSSLFAVTAMAHAVPNFCVNRKAFPKHVDNCNTVYGEMEDLPWRNIWSADNPVVDLNEHQSQVVGRYRPNIVNLMRNNDNLCFDDHYICAFNLKQEAHVR